MIAPPVSRLQPSPAQIAARNAAANGGNNSSSNNAAAGGASGRRPTVTGATNISVGGGGGAASRTNTMAGGNGGRDDDEKVITTPGAPLMQRPAAAITGDVNMWTLTFKDAAMENKYRQDTTELFPQSMRQLASSCMAVCVLGIVVDISAFGDATSVFPIKFGLIGASFLLSLILLVLRRRSDPFDTPSQRIFGVLFFLIGATWTVGIEVKNDDKDVNRQSQPGAIILMLIAGHFTSHTMLFTAYAYSSGLTSMVYIIMACIFSPDPWARIIFNLLIVIASWALLSRAHYAAEYAARMQFVHSVKAILSLLERNAMKKDALALRDEVFLMTLQKYGIADLDSVKLELKSPLEQAMAKLQGIQKKRVLLPNDVFNDIQEAITCLGTSSDIFKPQISKEIAKRGLKIDEETERWITDLANGDTGGSDKDKEKQAAANAGANATSPNGTVVRHDRPGSGVRGGSGGAAAAANNGGGFGLPGSVPIKTKEEKQYHEILEGMDDWNFDVFGVSAATKGKPVIFLGMALFKRYNLISKFNLDRTKLTNFLTAIETGYHTDAPYHNSTHAADVARTVHFFLETGKLRECMTDLEILGALIASLVHDYDHPGRTNAFHIAIREEKAILYNDKSVLENHHCAQAFFLLRKEENNILSHFTTQQFTSLRKTIVELVLATDLGVHFDFLGQFKSVAIDKTSEKSRLSLLKMALKCADLGHSAKILPLHEKWTLRITEEFYRQGDDERKAGIPISPFMDRSKANVPQSQVGFMDFLVMPMFNIWVPVMALPKDQFPCDKQLVENRNHWKKQLDKQKEGADNLLQQTPATPAPATTAATTSAPSGTLPPPSQAIATTAVVPVSVAAPPAEVRLTLTRADSRPPPSSASVAPAPIGGVQNDRRKSVTGITVINSNGGNTNRNESKMQRHDSHH